MPSAPKRRSLAAWQRAQVQRLRAESPWEFVVLAVVTLFLLLYGLVPIFGGDQLGLVGADEPRYAQIAREMLAAHSAACHEAHAKMVPRSLRLADIATRVAAVWRERLPR